MEFERNDYSGEQQIIDTLTKYGKFIPTEKFDEQFETLRLDAQDILFDADAVQHSPLRRKAAVRSGWFWLPRDGLDQLVKLAIQRGFWRDREGLIAKKWERLTKVIARLDDFGPNPIETGRFQVNVTPEDAGPMSWGLLPSTTVLIGYNDAARLTPEVSRSYDSSLTQIQEALLWPGSTKNRTRLRSRT